MFGLTDDEDIRGRHALLGLMAHHVQLTRVQPLVDGIVAVTGDHHAVTTGGFHPSRTPPVHRPDNNIQSSVESASAQKRRPPELPGTPNWMGAFYREALYRLQGMLPVPRIKVDVSAEHCSLRRRRLRPFAP